MRLGVLNAYHVDKDPSSYQAEFLPMCLSYLERVFEGTQMQVYEIPQGQWPADVHECEAWLITGSSKSAYDEDHWILQLLDFIKEAYQQNRKIVGICFGHQVVAQALGGTVEKSSNGWGVGVREFAIVGSASFLWPQVSRCALLYTHQDQVTSLPPGAALLGQDSFCENQMYHMGSRVFCLQGHPEFTKEFAKARWQANQKSIGSPQYEKAVESLNQATDEDLVGAWIHHFLQETTRRD